MNEFGCSLCWDARKHKEKEYLWYLDATNNLRQCKYCPNCGRKYGEAPMNEQLESTTDSDAV